MVYVSKKPLWVEHMPSLNRVNPKVFTSHTYLVLHQVKLSTTNVIFEIREVNGRLCIEEVGVDLELCVHAHENDVDRLGSFLQMITQLYDSFGILEIDSLQLWFRPCCPDLIYLMGIHSSASSIFGKVEVSTVIGQ
mgnify:CR=1 FL=1